MNEKKLYTEQLKNSLLAYKRQLKKLNKYLCFDHKYYYDYDYSNSLAMIEKRSKLLIARFEIPEDFSNNIVIKKCYKGRVLEYVKIPNDNEYNEYDVYLRLSSNPIIVLISLKDYLTAKIKTLEEMVNYDEKS